MNTPVIQPHSPIGVPNGSAALTSRVGLTAFVCVLMFLLLNPFLALLFLAFISLSYRIPTPVVVLSAATAFTLFFYFRDYGVVWYPSATDDVPSYINLYYEGDGISYGELFKRFLEAPNGNEILWSTPWWALINGFDASPETFVFLHYFLIFLMLFIALATLSPRYLPALAVVYFLLIPISIDSIAYIWRQQLAFSVFLAGVGLYMVRGRNSGLLLIFGSVLVHVATTFFVVVFLIFEFLRRRGAFANKLKVSLILLGVLSVIPIASTIIIRVLDTIGLERVLDYLLDSGNVDPRRVYLLMGGYVLPLVVAFYVLRNDAANNLFMVLCLATFSLVLAIPSANSVYDRLLMFCLPLLSLNLFRCLMINFPAGWRIVAVLFAFLVGVLRIHASAVDGSGPGAFLAYGHAFDPMMGVLNMLTSL